MVDQTRHAGGAIDNDPWAINEPQTAEKLPDGLLDAIVEHHAAVNGLLNGDLALWVAHCSPAEDITVAGGWGGIDRGTQKATERYRWASSNFKAGGNTCFFENISIYLSDDLAFSLDIERNEVTLKGRDERIQMGLRVSTVFRREAGGWKMVYRHGDPFVKEQPLGAVDRK